MSGRAVIRCGRFRSRAARAPIRFVAVDTPVDFVLANDVDVESIVADLASYKSIALVFPKWVDGRAYSQARLLRSRFGFKGEIRATGEVLADMMPLLVRTGFDAAAMRADQVAGSRRARPRPSSLTATTRAT